MNEKIRKVNGENSGSPNVTRGRNDKKSNAEQRGESQSKVKFAIIYYHYSRRGHKKPDYRCFEKEIECRKNTNDRKDAKGSNFRIEISLKENERTILSLMFSLKSYLMQRKFFVPHSSDGASTLHVHSMQIIKWEMIDTLLIVNDAMNQI